MYDQIRSSHAAARIWVIESDVVRVAQSLRRLRFLEHNLANPSPVAYGYCPPALLSHERQPEWELRSDAACAIIRAVFVQKHASISVEVAEKVS